MRPLKSDRAALLLATRTARSRRADSAGSPTRPTARDTLSTDGLWQPLKDTELYGRFALKFGANSREGLMNASALTYLAQLRANVACAAPSTWRAKCACWRSPLRARRRTSVGTELGYWVFADIRIGVGYNFTSATEPGRDSSSRSRAASTSPSPPSSPTSSTSSARRRTDSRAVHPTRLRQLQRRRRARRPTLTANLPKRNRPTPHSRRRRTNETRALTCVAFIRSRVGGGGGARVCVVGAHACGRLVVAIFALVAFASTASAQVEHLPVARTRRLRHLRL